MKLLMTDAEAAQLLGIHRASVWRHCKAGILPKPIKIGGATRWRRDELEATIAASTAARDKREVA